ncbi:Indian hedgehog B protein [Gracilariopsis chorda]|uniref:Indian hedgehog B protein n=1 Tax=Gracilariopsis chorda TaxID=448386 RepID=A0A2V3J669_9FLOR|nr:Indian hedgehog B protein [Gracilariopsis chorda]|eukprot:PXF49921.1 Indian hedgehog B protein [Gracilariopsis chorda]
MRGLILALLTIPLVVATPYIVEKRHAVHEDTPASTSPLPREADIENSTFVLVTKTEGCINRISHGIVRYPPFEPGVALALNLSPPEALIPFDNISVSGQTCSHEDLHEVLALYDPSKIALTDVGVNADDIPHIYVAGVDAGSRTCGKSRLEPRVYLFTSNLQHLFRANQRLGGVELDISERSVEDDPKAAYMLSVPRSKSQNACLYRRRPLHIPESAKEPAIRDDPRPSPEEDDESTAETEEPNSGSETLSGPERPNTFSVANDEAQKLEEQEALKSEDKCFPGSAMVQLENGHRIPMSDVRIGHRVLVAPETFSTVFMFTHRVDNVLSEFIQIRTETGEILSLTASHYIYLDSSLVPAKYATTGQQVQLSDGRVSFITAVSTVRDSGLYNPQTLHGDIVVDNIRVSSYTDAVKPHIAHSMLAPLRAVFDRFGFYVTGLENGGGTVLRTIQKLIPSVFIS